MKRQFKKIETYLFLLSVVLGFFFLSGCTQKEVEGLSRMVSTDPDARVGDDSGGDNISPAPEITYPESRLKFNFPVQSNYPVGYKVLVKGECNTEFGNVLVKMTSGVTNSSKSVVCGMDGRFETYADASSVNTGIVNLTIQQTVPNGQVNSENMNLKKSHTNCDVAANRTKDYSSGLAAGDGTISNPYFICTAQQLAEVSNSDDEQNFVLGNDIYFKSGDTNGDFVVDVNDQDYLASPGWLPLTKGAKDFDGNGYTIYDLKIDRPSTDYVGLFGSVEVYIHDLTLVDSVVKGANNTGTLFGRARYSSVVNIKLVNPVVEGNDKVGGVGGRADESIVAAVNVINLSVTSAGNGVGGIIGEDGSVLTSKVSGQITGNLRVGGIMGTRGVISYSYSTADVSGNSSLGGVLGGAGRVIGAYASGNIAGTGSSVGCISGAYSIPTDTRFNIGACASVTGGSSVGHMYYGGSSGPDGYYIDSMVCSAADLTVCGTHGATAVTLESLYSKNHTAYASWEFRGSTSAGYSGIWVEQPGALPKLFFEVEPNSLSIPFSGSGTVTQPYLITSADDLVKIEQFPQLASAHFRLTQSIDMNDLTTGSFTPLFSHLPFSGSFDGGGFKISNLNLDFTGHNFVGLFAIGIGAVSVKDLHINWGALIGHKYVGGLMGYSHSANGAFQKIRVSGSAGITANGEAGGFIGRSRDILNQIETHIDLACTEGTCGGLVGYYSGRRVEDSYTTGNISTNTGRIGGIFGVNVALGGSYRRLYSTGSVSSTTSMLVGGITGQSHSYVYESFSLSEVSGVDNDGADGIAIGGLFGINGISSNYYLPSVVACTNNGSGGACNLTGTNADPFAIDFSYFFDSSNAPLNSWDFTTVWDNNSNTQLPFLRGMPAL